MKIDFFDSLNTGKKTRLKRLLYKYGPGNGKLMILPYDQGLEHGPRDFFVNHDSKNPEYIYKLAIEGGFSAVAVQVGIAQKYHHKYAGDIPLVLKLNGKTEIPSDEEALSPLNADVEDAVRLGADAVGYTLYVGSPRQDEDFIQFKKVRQDALKYGMPLIIWSYPRGQAIEKKGGKNSFYAIDYAARVAQELGADVVKLNFPQNGKHRENMPQPYGDLKWDPEKSMEEVVHSAGNTLVIVSGGSKIDDEALMKKIEHSLKAGVAGIIFGRNIWQREWEKALEIAHRIKEVMKKY
ncbi:MAG: class I fructose-bisphosphate aldolase [Vulcanimicrobiota bacterium]